jgi:hypothetical protein
MDERLVGSWRLLSLRMESGGYQRHYRTMGNATTRLACRHSPRATDHRHDSGRPIATQDRRRGRGATGQHGLLFGQDTNGWQCQVRNRGRCGLASELVGNSPSATSLLRAKFCRSTPIPLTTPLIPVVWCPSCCRGGGRPSFASSLCGVAARHRTCHTTALFRLTFRPLGHP